MSTATSRNIFYHVEDVMELLGVSRSKAYKIIQDLNDELKKNGYIVAVAGRVPKKFFNERFYCDIETPETVKLERRASR